MTRAYLTHVSSLIFTKLADGFIDPKLVIAWLLNALGAPGYIIGILVPVREAGSLLPQVFLARKIEARSRRKIFWIVGSAVQGIAALGIAICAILLEGAAAGWSILVCLAILAVARASCSASYKDILARTVQKGKRGKVSGLAGTVAAVGVFMFAILVGFDLWPREPFAIAMAVMFAGILWLAAALIFASLKEPEAERQTQTKDSWSAVVEPLVRDSELQTYIATRALLISTALAPPFLVMLDNLGSSDFGNLGFLMIASSLAAIGSSYLWGALSDYSSRKTLMIAGVAAALTYAIAVWASLADVTNFPLLIPALLFVAQLSYHGARAGRKTHLTDMDAKGRTAVYTTLSNTIIGIMLLFGGILGIVADRFGPQTVLAILGLCSFFAVLTAWRLSEVQADET